MDIYSNLKEKSIIRKINELFYEKVYEHQWLAKYFVDVSKEFIISQQTDYIIGEIGGPKLFSGRLPYNAHPHMYLTNDLFDIRESLLKQAFDETDAPEELRSVWLKIDKSFRSIIVKKSLDDCMKRFRSDKILAFDKNGKRIKV